MAHCIRETVGDSCTHANTSFLCEQSSFYVEFTFSMQMKLSVNRTLVNSDDNDSLVPAECDEDEDAIADACECW